jgi:hypothetical protein
MLFINTLLFVKEIIIRLAKIIQFNFSKAFNITAIIIGNSLFYFYSKLSTIMFIW